MTESLSSRVASWVHQAPIAELSIGSYTLAYQFSVEVKGGGWICWNAPDDFHGSDEHSYLCKLIKENRISYKELGFMDTVLKALEANPYKETI